MSVLRLDDLSVTIRETPILEHVCLEIGAGEIYGLVGESGSGKSMTALAIMGLLPGGSQASGTVSLGGDVLTGLTEDDLRARRGRDMAMVFQEPMTALNPLHTIGDQVAETIRIHRNVSRQDAHALAVEALARVDLAPDQYPPSRYPHELSGGQRQRVCIAMAIVLKPALLIADEPTTALDVVTQARILDLLQRLAREDGLSLMLITHDLAVVAARADRVGIMQAGRIVEQGPTGAVFARQTHPYTRALFAASTHRPKRSVRAGTPDVLLEARNITRVYRGRKAGPLGHRPLFRAVDQVSLTLHQGENLGLVGESGCGKSTLARALLGLEAVQGGEVRLGGVCVSTARGAALTSLRRQIQVVFQDPFGSFNPRHRVGRIVAEPFHLVTPRPDRSGIRRQVEVMLEQVGLKTQDADKFPHEFSGGQRQRIAIARALVTKPRIVILDEAVSALDVSVRAQILDLLAGLSDHLGVSYLFISHDLSVVRTITDRVMVMRAGRIVEEGETEAIFTAPSHPYTKDLLAASPAVELVRGAEAPRPVPGSGD